MKTKTKGEVGPWCPKTHKVIHRYKHQAEIAMIRLMTSRAWDHETVHVYRCPFGHHWHMGHARRRMAPARSQCTNVTRADIAEKAGEFLRG